MAEEQPGGAIGGHVRVAIQDLGQAGQQFRNQAQNLEDQVISPLSAVDSSHGASWQGGSRAAYQRLHEGLLASLGHVRQATGRMGVMMGQSAGAYGVLNQTRFNGAGRTSDGSDPFDTIRVAGAGRQAYAAPELEKFYKKYQSQGVTKVALTPDQLARVKRAQEMTDPARLNAAEGNLVSRLKGKCWGVDESGNLMYNGRKDEQAMVDNIMSSVRDRTPQNGMRNWFDKYGYDFENRGANDGGVPGQAAASDVEKLLAIGDNQTFPPGMSKTVGVSLEQCRDCRQFYWCLSQEVGADQYVAGPEEARIYFGTGEGAGDIGMVAYENGQRVMYRVPKALAQKLLWTPDSSFPWV